MISRFNTVFCAVAATVIAALPAAAEDTVKIAYVDPLSGGGANVGEYGLNFFQYLADETNARSVVDAVNCALSLQRSNGALPDEAFGQPKIVLRIGINLGDVIIEGDDIYGDGVNIAARLEPLAEPGGICASSIVNESIGNRINDVAAAAAGRAARFSYGVLAKAWC